MLQRTSTSDSLYRRIQVVEGFALHNLSTYFATNTERWESAFNDEKAKVTLLRLSQFNFSKNYPTGSSSSPI
jgi:hypothetical protein